MLQVHRRVDQDSWNLLCYYLQLVCLLPLWLMVSLFHLRNLKETGNIVAKLGALGQNAVLCSLYFRHFVIPPLIGALVHLVAFFAMLHSRISRKRPLKMSIISGCWKGVRPRDNLHVEHVEHRTLLSGNNKTPIEPWIRRGPKTELINSLFQTLHCVDFM